MTDQNNVLSLRHNINSTIFKYEKTITINRLLHGKCAQPQRTAGHYFI